MFKNQKAESYQSYCDDENIYFHPDSSPLALTHFKKVYAHNEYLNKNYDFSKAYFYNPYGKFGLKHGYKDGLEYYNYINKPLRNGEANRLFILKRGTKIKKDFKTDTEYIVPANRLGGDCDFNFNEKKSHLFLEIIKCDTIASQHEKDDAVNQLSRCRDMHHQLLNFSLMQSVGNIQKFKSSNRFDRLDTFISELDKYFRGISNNVLQYASTYNEPALISFLNDFKSIYDYCKTFYFINDKRFVDQLIIQGRMPITTVNELVRYMNLAEKFWAMKECEFLKMND